METSQLTVAQGGAPDNAPSAPKEGAGVRVVQRAFVLLECLTASSASATLTDFSKQTGLATTTVKRLLDTLEGADILRRLPDGRYTHGSRLLQISLSALGGVELYDLAERHVERLSALSGETANFGILNGDGQVLYLRQTQSPHAIRHASWLGHAFPADGTAIGAALKGKAAGAGVVTTRKTLEPDVSAVAAPIYGPGGTIAGAISVTGPTFRLDDDAIVRCEKLVAAEAAELTVRIGGLWPHGAETRGMG
jgi:DNA-binding IclR family transcriptional regulator